jgi:hypothetical protein
VEWVTDLEIGMQIRVKWALEDKFKSYGSTKHKYLSRQCRTWTGNYKRRCWTIGASEMKNVNDAMDKLVQYDVLYRRIMGRNNLLV